MPLVFHKYILIKLISLEYSKETAIKMLSKFENSKCQQIIQQFYVDKTSQK